MTPLATHVSTVRGETPSSWASFFFRTRVGAGAVSFMQSLATSTLPIPKRSHVRYSNQIIGPFREHARPQHRRRFSPVFTGEVVADSVALAVVGALCSALAASARGGSFSRACHPGAAHFLQSCGHGGVPGTRRGRGMGHAADRRGRSVRHPLAHALRSAVPIAAR